MNQEIALLKESRNQIAVRHGLPPIGARMVNQHGIEWLVDGHLFVPTLFTIARRGGIENIATEDPQDLYPVIVPQNLSPRLTNFLAETEGCTSKFIMPLDTMPHLRPKGVPPHAHAVDGLSSSRRSLLFLDAAHVHETVLAHEIGHLWIDLVDDCEDYRRLKDLSDATKVFQWTHLQSFVLDNKVNQVLREKGFDLSVIEANLDEALANFVAALHAGYHPPTAREAVFVALTLATVMLEEETGATEGFPNLERAITVFSSVLPSVYQLACDG